MLCNSRWRRCSTNSPVLPQKNWCEEGLEQNKYTLLYKKKQREVINIWNKSQFYASSLPLIGGICTKCTLESVNRKGALSLSIYSPKEKNKLLPASLHLQICCSSHVLNAFAYRSRKLGCGVKQGKKETSSLSLQWKSLYEGPWLMLAS